MRHALRSIGACRCVRWHVAYLLSLCHGEELMEECGMK